MRKSLDNYIKNYYQKLKSKNIKMAMKKSSDLVETTKLKLSVTDTENEIDNIMRKMGELLYEAYKTGGESYSSLEEQCELIDSKYEKIEELTKQISEHKNAKICPNCKKQMEKDASFCSSCGAKF